MVKNFKQILNYQDIMDKCKKEQDQEIERLKNDHYNKVV